MGTARTSATVPVASVLLMLPTPFLAFTAIPRLARPKNIGTIMATGSVTKLIINAIRIETMAMPRALFLRGLKVSTAAFLSESVIGRTDAENPGMPPYI